jgi:anti-sigma factor RsiW
MADHLGERLSAYLDGELSGESLVAAEAHLAACAECQVALDDLRRITRRAQSLDDRLPERDLWTDIAARLSSGSEPSVVPLALRRRRFVFSLPQLAAAGIALIALSSGAAVVLTHTARTGAPSSTEAGTAAEPIAGLASAKGVRSYDAAIRDLEATLAARRSKLDTATVRSVVQSLAIIDGAIRQAEAALAQDPNSMYLNSHLEQALGRKLDVLRRVTTLATAS